MEPDGTGPPTLTHLHLSPFTATATATAAAAAAAFIIIIIIIFSFFFSLISLLPLSELRRRRDAAGEGPACQSCRFHDNHSFTHPPTPLLSHSLTLSLSVGGLEVFVVFGPS